MNSIDFPRHKPLLSVVFLASQLLLASGCGASPAVERSVPTPAPAPPRPASPYKPGPSTEEIRAAVDSRNNDLRQCYLAGTFKNAALSGTVNVTFTIDTSGHVKDAADSGSEFPDPEVVQCVLGVFAQLTFEGGGTTGTEVTYPIRFGNQS